MTLEQFEKAREFHKLINNHKGILAMLQAGMEPAAKQVEVRMAGVGYTINERLVHEFIHATQHSLNKLEEEFNQL